MSSENQIKVKIRLFATLRDVFNTSEVELSLDTTPTITGLFEVLCDSSKRRRMLFDRSGNIRSHVKILKNGRNIDFISGKDTQLADGDVVAVFPPIGGG